MYIKLVGHTNAVRAVTMMSSYANSLAGHNAVWIASGSHDTTVRVWDVFDAEPCKIVFVGHTGWVVSVADVGGGLLVSSSVDGTVRVWDLFEETCAYVLRDIHTQSTTIWNVCPSRTHGGRFSTCGGDGTVKLWRWTKDRVVVPVIESTKEDRANTDHSRAVKVKVVHGAQQSVHDKAVTAFIEELENLDEAKKAELAQSAAKIQQAWRKKKAAKLAVALVTTKQEKKEEAEHAAAEASAHHSQHHPRTSAMHRASVPTAAASVHNTPVKRVSGGGSSHGGSGKHGAGSGRHSVGRPSGTRTPGSHHHSKVRCCAITGPTVMSPNPFCASCSVLSKRRDPPRQIFPLTPVCLPCSLSQSGVVLVHDHQHDDPAPTAALSMMNKHASLLKSALAAPDAFPEHNTEEANKAALKIQCAWRSKQARSEPPLRDPHTAPAGLSARSC